MSTRPNILFLMSDEHRPDVAGYEGNAVVRTPILDELARTGVVFRNAYTPSPICIPGRQCLASGQLPKTCGVRRFGEDLPPNYMTFPRRLSQWAYSTVCSGKLHHVGRDQMQGWTRRVAPDMFVNESFIEDRNEEEFARYDDRHPRWKWSDLVEVHRTRPNSRSRNQKFDLRATEAALDYIEDYFVDMTYDRATPQRPLMLKLSLLQPHYPYITDHDKFVYYFNRVEPFVNEEVFDHPFLSRRAVPVSAVPVGDGATEREIRRTTAAYYGMIETIDSQYGEVLDALRNIGQNLDDWIIIYTSDHGEMLGEHGIWEKQKFFEASARVPLIIRWPKKFKPRVVEENVNLCDLFATLCDLTEVPTPDGLDSRSLVPLLEGKSEGWNNETISQFGADNLMIKRDHLKYQSYGEEMPEVLFDLRANPQETVNFINDPEYSEAVAGFRQRRAELGYGPDADPNYHNAGY